MKKKKQLYAILAATLILAAGYGVFTFSEKKTQEAPLEEEDFTPPETWQLTELKKTDLNKVTLQNETGGFTLVSQGEQWQLEGREELELDQQGVSSFLSALTRIISFERVSPDGVKPEDYGLDDGAGSAILNLADGSNITLRIGSSNPSGSGRYVQKTGDPAIYLLSSFVSQKLLTNINALRDRSLPAVNSQRLTYITIQSDRTIEIVPFFQFEQFANTMSPFLMIQPYKRPVPVDAEELSKGFESLFNGLTIESFIDEGTPASVTGLPDSAKTLSLKDESGQELTLLVGKENDKGGYYCAIPGKPEIFTLKKETLTLLDRQPFDLTDHFVRLVGIDLVGGLTVHSPEGTWTGEIRKIDEETTEYYFQGEQVEEDQFKKMYQEVLYLLTEGEISLPFSPEEPVITIEYQGNSENPGKTKADFFEYNRDFYAVGIDGYEPEFLIGKYQLEKLQEYLKNVPSE